MRKAPWIASIALLFGAACGARSALEIGGGPNGSGGAGPSSSIASSTATTTTTTGSGGAGGAPPELCPALALDPAITSIAVSGRSLRYPTLLAVGTPGLSLLYDAALPADAFTSTLSISTFDPWTTWPASSVSVAMERDGQPLDARRDRSFAVTRNAATADGTFQVSFEADEGTTEDSVFFGPAATSAGQVIGKGAKLDQAYPPTSLSQARTGTRTLLFTTFATKGLKYPWSLLRVTANTAQYPVIGGACARGSLSADVTAVSDGWTVAAALGTRFSWKHDPLPDFNPSESTSCSVFAASAGRPRQIFTGHASADGHHLTGNAAVLAEPNDIRALRLAPTGTDDVWVAWGVGGDGGADALRVARLGGDAQMVLGAVTLPAKAGAPVASSLGIASFGSDVVVAVVEVAGDGTRVVVVHHLDAAGHEIAGAVLATNGAVNGAVTLSADPRGVIVAWSELPSGATGEVLRVAKLACAGGT